MQGHGVEVCWLSSLLSPCELTLNLFEKETWGLLLHPCSQQLENLFP